MHNHDRVYHIHDIIQLAYILIVLHFKHKQGNQRWQTSPAAPPGGLGHCHTGMCMSNFMMIGWEMAEILHIEISRKHVSVTYDLDLWPKILKIFVSHGVPIRNMYAKFHNDRLRNGWDITLWNFAKTRTNKHTHTQTNKHTDMGMVITYLQHTICHQRTIWYIICYLAPYSLPIILVYASHLLLTRWKVMTLTLVTMLRCGLWHWHLTYYIISMLPTVWHGDYNHHTLIT